MVQVSITVNGKARRAHVEPRMLLVHFLREELRLTGTHVGCDTSQCGACVVHVDGLSVKSCSTLAVTLAGASVTTIEGLSEDGRHALQLAWQEIDVPQCGYCQAGQIMAATALLNTTAKPNDKQIDDAMSGNACRCGTYVRIREAIKTAAGVDVKDTREV